MAENKSSMHWRIAASAALFAILAGCAAPRSLVPENYKGPTAYLEDTVYQESGSKGRIFAAVALDGQGIRSAFEATRQASANRGFSLWIADDGRKVVVKPTRVTLRASHVTAAPIHELALRAGGAFFEVEGTVDFTPKADVTYVVRGELKREGSSVWIEERETKIKASEVVVGK